MRIRRALVALGASATLATLVAGSGAAGRGTPLLPILRPVVSEGGSPAIVVAVAENGRIRSVAAGYSDARRRTPARAGGRFWVGSTTKAFVATVVLQLVQEGKLSLDDTVERRLPGVLSHGEVLVRHLLSHTSGIPDYMGRDPFRSATSRSPRAVVQARELIESVARDELSFEPGSRSAYSNTNYLLLGAIVERLTGRSLRQELESRIFTPLKLTATEYESPGRQLRGGRMRGYAVEGGVRRDVTLYTLAGPWADGAIVSNARDLARFFTALLAGKLVEPQLLRLMKTPVFPGGHSPGLGLWRLSSPCRRLYLGHNGGTPGYATFAAATPDGKRAVVAAINGVGPSTLQRFGKAVDRLLCLR